MGNKGICKALKKQIQHIAQQFQNATFFNDAIWHKWKSLFRNATFFTGAFWREALIELHFFTSIFAMESLLKRTWVAELPTTLIWRIWKVIEDIIASGFQPD